jgi:hypothetical protein
MGPTDWRSKYAEAIGGAVGVAVALSTAGWPNKTAEAAWALVGLIVGLGIVLGLEYVLHMRAEVKRLHGIEAQAIAERAERAEERKWWEYQIAVAKRESESNAVGVKVFGGVVAEAQRTGHILPSDAILARMEIETKAANLDVPLGPPKSPGS